MLGIRTKAEWSALSTDDQYDWIAYVKRRRKDAQAIGKYVTAAAERDEHFTIEKATYIAIMTIAQELL